MPNSAAVEGEFETVDTGGHAPPVQASRTISWSRPRVQSDFSPGQVWQHKDGTSYEIIRPIEDGAVRWYAAAYSPSNKTFYYEGLIVEQADLVSHRTDLE